MDHLAALRSPADRTPTRPFSLDKNEALLCIWLFNIPSDSCVPFSAQICAHIGLTKMQRCLSPPRLKVLWGRDGFWKIAPPPPPSLISHWTSEVAVKMVSSKPALSSPSLHQFSYCRPESLGGTPQTPQNTSRIPPREYLPEGISHISDNSLCCRRPS